MWAKPCLRPQPCHPALRAAGGKSSNRTRGQARSNSVPPPPCPGGQGIPQPPLEVLCASPSGFLLHHCTISLLWPERFNPSLLRATACRVASVCSFLSTRTALQAGPCTHCAPLLGLPWNVMLLEPTSQPQPHLSPQAHQCPAQIPPSTKSPHSEGDHYPDCSCHHRRRPSIRR